MTYIRQEDSREGERQSEMVCLCVWERDRTREGEEIRHRRRKGGREGGREGEAERPHVTIVNPNGRRQYLRRVLKLHARKPVFCPVSEVIALQN